jgi:hypothetical protein
MAQNDKLGEGKTSDLEDPCDDSLGMGKTLDLGDGLG